jgi:hypothetical protein
MSDEVARVSTVIAVHPRDAFEVFTEEIATWWRRSPRHRGSGTMRFVDRARLVETMESGATFEVGRVLAWEPGARLAFEYRTRDFAPGEETRVDVRFEAVEQGTRVTIEHAGWGSIPIARRPKRLTGTALASAMGLFWADLAQALAGHARSTRGGDQRA